MTKPDDLLDIAYKIQAAHHEEIGTRSSINRAYYAAYHSANSVVNFLLLPDAIKEAKGSHQRLYNRLMECEAFRTKDWIAVRNIGRTATMLLKPYRVHADYHLDKPIAPEAATEMLAKVSTILAKQKAIAP